MGSWLKRLEGERVATITQEGPVASRESSSPPMGSDHVTMATLSPTPVPLVLAGGRREALCRTMDRSIFMGGSSTGPLGGSAEGAETSGCGGLGAGGGVRKESPHFLRDQPPRALEVTCESPTMTHIVSATTTRCTLVTTIHTERQSQPSQLK